jgi:transcriptional regulator with XRE-family HTH domain
MNLPEIGHEIRRARLSHGLTQAQLASAANITRTTLNQLENGLIKDLGIRKIQALFDQLGLTFLIDRAPDPKSSDYLRVASMAASVSFKTTLTDDELRRILLTGKVPSDRRAHMGTLLEEAPKTLLNSLIQQMRRSTDPGKLERNLIKIAMQIGLPVSSIEWMTKDQQPGKSCSNVP